MYRAIFSSSSTASATCRISKGQTAPCFSSILSSPSLWLLVSVLSEDCSSLLCNIGFIALHTLEVFFSFRDSTPTDQRNKREGERKSTTNAGVVSVTQRRTLRRLPTRSRSDCDLRACCLHSRRCLQRGCASRRRTEWSGCHDSSDWKAG